ncbi:MAG: 2-hydroxy-3-oxopropionate reductase [Paracidovorax wautersii]|uniref:2-hydroxy-3-oxopropionate reductase n=1 Tax=Paracidovorax wautersii TaxID=1177982 RepID=A0A7V8FRH8_9BURK|nr:MAG: 2-hydroxy-3-oxopropionate reductase [Paracidovorax wautersii]
MNDLSQRIGLIGVGLMGQGIALSLQRHGRALTLLEHAGNQPLDELVAAGAQTAAQPREVAAACGVVILCVTGSPQVRSVMQGPQGLLAGLRPGTVVIDCSTSIPADTRVIAAEVHAAGGRFIDAPMTRTVQHAREGRLNLLVGGDAAVLAEVEPVLRCFAENIAHAGSVGAGHEMKLLHNFVSLGSAVLLAEAAACAARSGVDARVLVDVLGKGGGAGVALERMKPFLLDGDASSLPFYLANAAKDLGYYVQMASDAGAVSAMAQAALDDVARGVARAGGQVFMPELAALLRE